MGTKPADPDGLDIRLSWPQGHYAEPSTARRKTARRSPAGASSATPAEAPPGGSSDGLPDLVARVERLDTEIRSQIRDLAEKVDRLSAAQGAAVDRVVQAIEELQGLLGG